LNKTYKNFTDKFVLGLPIPAKTQKCAFFRDMCQKGLCLLVSYGGTKTFYFNAKLNKRRLITKIGQFPYMSVDDARERAFLMLKDIKNGINPLTAKYNSSQTLQSFFDNEYMNDYARKYKQPAYCESHIKMFAHYLGVLRDMELLEIKRDDIDKFHKKIGQNNGKYIANRCLAFIRHILNIAIEFGFLETNPASKIRMYEEKSRDRFLQPYEITRFLKAVNESESEQFRDFTLLLLYTGQRRSNIASLKWNQIDFYNNTMYLPHTKNGDPQIIPLTNQALDLIKRIKESQTTDNEYIFPSPKSKPGHITGSKSYWKKILDAAGIDNLRIHDLRRTMGSYQAITGTSLNIIGKSLGHRSVGATMIYARLNLDPVRSSMQKAADEMNKIYENPLQ
jgi:integrase